MPIFDRLEEFGPGPRRKNEETLWNEDLQDEESKVLAPGVNVPLLIEIAAEVIGLRFHDLVEVRHPRCENLRRDMRVLTRLPIDQLS